MSTKNTLLINVGLTALGWLGFAASSVADPEPPAPSGPPAAPAATPAPVSSRTPTVLSLNDGRILLGKVQEDDAGFSVTQNGGVLRFRKELVEGTFGSLQEAYRFKAERVPGRDPDERIKLADWCLTHHLRSEAKAQLLAVLELCPGSADIKYRIDSIDMAIARAAIRDEGIERTRGERPVDGRPAELDADVFRPGRGAAAPLGLPTIFDLPTTQAVMRADEFTNVVHKVLQARCVRCHNENYRGDFQLIEVKNRHQWTPNVARANLEATLRMIDPDSPSRSELLSRALVPHGPSRRPIFRGANDPEYQRIASWVGRLRSRPATDPDAGAAAATSVTTMTRFGPMAPVPPIAGSDPDGFATDRLPPSAPQEPSASSTDGRPRPPATPNQVTPLPPGQFVAGSGSGMQPYAPPEADFPVPYMAGGPRPKVGATSTAPAPLPVPPAPGQGQGSPPATTTNDPALPPPATPVGAPPMPPSTTPAGASAKTTAEAEAGKTAAKPAKKPVKFDPSLLERALMNRNAPR